MLKLYLFLTITIFAVLYFSGCDIINSSQDKPDVPTDHNVNISNVLHAPGERDATSCKDCHGDDLRGGIRNLDGRYIFAQSCYQCHGKLWRTE